MKKLPCILCALCLGVSLAGCGAPKEPSAPEGQTVVSRIAMAENGNAYLEVDGRPFPFLGVEARLDAFMNCESRPLSDFEPYMRAAAELGATVIAVPVDWADLEPEKDSYDFRLVGTLLEWANKYNIKLDICWYSVNMCGESNSYQVPAYIYNDEATYPKYESAGKDSFWGYYGYQCYLEASSALMEREAKVIENMMDFVYNWDKNNGEKHPLVGVQVHNEPDGFPRWRLEPRSVKKNGVRITVDEAWERTNKLLDNAGKAFKRSKYLVYTHVNVMPMTNNSSDVEQWVKDIYDLDGIDAVGVDAYSTSTGALASLINSSRDLMPENFAHIGENKGIYSNTPSLILSTVKAGGGYNIYDLATPQYFINNTTEPDNIDHGILNGDLSDRAHTEATRRTLKALSDARDAITFASKNNFMLFNLESSNPETSYEKEKSTAHATVNFKTEEGAVGFAVEYNDYLYLFASTDTEVTLSGSVFSLAQYGGFGAEGWNAGESVRLSDGKLSLNAGKLVRVRIGA